MVSRGSKRHSGRRDLPEVVLVDVVPLSPEHVLVVEEQRRQGPVSPGRYRKAREIRGVAVREQAGVCGRGPTSVIWPKRTLISCGSSSTQVARRNRPSGVTLRSPGTVSVEPEASATMVRNLKIENNSPPWPIRDWRYRAGPLLVNRTASRDDQHRHREHEKRRTRHGEVEKASKDARSNASALHYESFPPGSLR